MEKINSMIKYLLVDGIFFTADYKVTVNNKDSQFIYWDGKSLFWYLDNVICPNKIYFTSIELR